MMMGNIFGIVLRLVFALQNNNRIQHRACKHSVRRMSFLTIFLSYCDVRNIITALVTNQALLHRKLFQRQTILYLKIAKNDL